MSSRRYDEREVAQILRLAAESQVAGSGLDGAGPGLTLEEIRRFAEEVGISPDHVSAAAVRLDQDSENRRFWIWGAPTHFSRAVTCKGSLDDAAWDEAVDEARRAFGFIGRQGRTTVNDRTREWISGYE